MSTLVQLRGLRKRDLPEENTSPECGSVLR